MHSSNGRAVDVAAPIEAGSALVELLPRVVHDDAAVIAVRIADDRGAT